jgi:hypothetical protein
MMTATLELLLHVCFLDCYIVYRNMLVSFDKPRASNAKSFEKHIGRV